MLSVAPQTVHRDWSLAKAWLVREMNHEGDHNCRDQFPLSVRGQFSTTFMSSSAPCGMVPATAESARRCSHPQKGTVQGGLDTHLK